MNMRTPEPEAQAEALLSKVWGNSGRPIDPVYIALKLGVTVSTLDLPHDVSGAYFKEKGRDAYIVVNEKDSVNRRRFTIAHELGHHVLRVASGQITDDVQIVDLRSDLAGAGTDASEIFANKFAAALLMPRRLVEQAIEEGYSLPALCAAFKISEEAMGYRLKSLNLKCFELQDDIFA